MGASQIIDRVHSLATAESLSSEPGAFAEALAVELPVGHASAAVAARDAALAEALNRIDEMSVRVMRSQLDHVLAADTSIPAPTRKVFALTIISYANRLPLLAERVRDVAARSRADADAVADAVVRAAEATFVLRDAVAAGVFDLVVATARAALPEVEKLARDRTRDDAERTRHSALRRELEALTTAPDRVRAAPFAERLKAWPDQLDDPPPEAEVTFADMIEMD